MGELFYGEVCIEKYNPHARAFQEVLHVVLHRDELLDLSLQFRIDRNQLFINRLKLFLRGLKLFVGRLQLFVGRLQLFVGRFKLFIEGLLLLYAGTEVILCAQKLPFQFLYPLRRVLPGPALRPHRLILLLYRHILESYDEHLLVRLRIRDRPYNKVKAVNAATSLHPQILADHPRFFRGCSVKREPELRL